MAIDRNSPKYVDSKLKKNTTQKDDHVISKGRIEYGAMGFFNDITGVPPAPAAYADLDNPGHSRLPLKRSSGSDKGISVKKFSSGAKK